MSDAADLSEDPPAEEMAGINSELETARDLLSDGHRDEALEVCKSILTRKNLPLRSAATLSLIMRELGQTQAADEIRGIVLSGVQANYAQIQESVVALLPVAESMADLGERDLAERMVRRALEIAPGDVRVLSSAVAFLAQTQRMGEAHDIAAAFAERMNHDPEILLYLYMMFGHYKAESIARDFLDMARERCTTPSQRAKLNYMLAASGVPVAELDQHGMAVNLFDSFAENYDRHLTALGNNGPSLVYTALEDLKLPKDNSRAILDAGCGTGLCAGFLRDYARTITGVDLSIKMLEKSREKRLYDRLARTDLSIPETFPEGTYDMIVCADVLVYFGALDTVFQNFRRVLNPGGWLIFTVEDELDPTVKSGFKLYTSGRHKHSDGYLLETLARTGFPKPRLLEHARLRNEMALPVLGTVVAVQKSALLAS
jgi:predicted TPR repeat methyltransferase